MHFPTFNRAAYCERHSAPGCSGSNAPLRCLEATLSTAESQQVIGFFRGTDWQRRCKMGGNEVIGIMKTKLFALMLLAGGSLFAESRFSISIGGYAPGYYAPPPVYYGGGYGGGYRGGYGGYGRYWGGAGYWGRNPGRQHERAEWYGLHNHQEGERYIYGDSPELREHQAQEQWQLRHEQWHERHGDYDAADGPAHESARDGWWRGN